MSVLVIEGQNKLSGEVNIQGAKNSILPILAATVLVKGTCVIENCPMLSDVDTSLKILKHFGVNSKAEKGVITVNNSGITEYSIPYELMNKMRSSVVFSGAVLGALKEVKISSPGGCAIGKRPIDLHIDVLQQLGAKLTQEDGYLYFTAKDGLTGTTISFPFKSVGATENAILAATLAKGKTVINNAATEPEISDLADFLNSCGAKIEGAGTERIVIEGVYTLHPCVHRIIPDRIAAATYMSAAAVTDGTLLINRVNVNHLKSVISAYKTAGCNIKTYDNSIEISSNGLRAIDFIESNVYPYFPTDAGPLLVTMLALAKGKSTFKENIFENRFKYVNELKKFGADIKVYGTTATVNGVRQFKSANCKCTDLRGGAALIIAALASNGVSVIDDIYHIKRGYCGIVGDLSKLGAKIKEI